MARVLVIDDDPDILRLLRLSLEAADHEVVTTAHPRQALDLIRENRPSAVVLDVMMPEITGWDVLASIRRDPEMRQLPVVMLSAMGEVEHRVRGIRLGADDYMTKPFDPEELVARVERIMARRQTVVSGLQGDLKVHPFSELVQSLEVARKSGGLKITAAGGVARLDLSEGRIVGVRFGALSGEEAFLALLEIEDGSFSFTTEERPSSDEQGREETFRAQALLLKAAWLEDELRELAQFLPGPEEVIEANDPPPDLSEIPVDLPVEKILDRLRTAPASLETLLKESLFSRNQVRLSVAWLRMHEGISVIGSRAVPEKLDSAIQGFIQEAALRGFPLDGLRLAILVAPGAWKGLAPLILSLPNHLLGADYRTTKRRVLQEQRGELRLHHERAALALEFMMLEPISGSMPKLEPGPAGVVVWAERVLDPTWVSFVEDLVAPSTTVLLVASPALILAADGFPEASRSWRWLTPAPGALSKVLQALSEARV